MDDTQAALSDQIDDAAAFAAMELAEPLASYRRDRVQRPPA